MNSTSCTALHTRWSLHGVRLIRGWYSNLQTPVSTVLDWIMHLQDLYLPDSQTITPLSIQIVKPVFQALLFRTLKLILSLNLFFRLWRSTECSCLLAQAYILVPVPSVLHL